MTAVNQLAAVLAAAARGGEGARWLRHEVGGRVVITPGLTFRRMVEDGFGGLIRFSSGHPRVLSRIAEVLGDLVQRLPAGDGRAALLQAAGWIDRAVQGGELAPHERTMVLERLAALGAPEQGARTDGPHAMH